MKQKNKKSVRVRAAVGYGPRHMMNAQEGSEAVPSELPSPPDWVEAQRRRVTRDGGMANLTPGILGGLGEAGSELAGMSKEEVAKLAISMLAGGEEMPLGEPGAVPLRKWSSWDTAQKAGGGRGPIKSDGVGNYYEQIGEHATTNPDVQHVIVKPVEKPVYDFGKWQEQVGKGGGQYEEPPLVEPMTPEEKADMDAHYGDLPGSILHKLGITGEGLDNPVPPTHEELNKAFGTNMPEGMSMDELLDWYAKGLGLKPKDPPPESPPEGMRGGKRVVGVAKGFGPGHAENSKEGEDLTKVNTDTVPAMLTPREAVLNRNAAELAGRGTIEKLNSEGNKLARKGVDLAAGGMADVKEKIMKSKVKSSKPAASGSPYVQAFQNLMPKGGAPVGYQGGGDSVPGGAYGLGARDQYGRQFSNRDASGGFASGNGVPPQPVIDPTPGPFPGRGPGGVYPQQPTPLADGTSNVGPIGTPPQGEQAYGPPVNLTAPQIQQLAKQTGISPTQIMGLMKAFQGGKDIYNSVGTGGYDTASPETSQAVGDAFGFGAQGMQGGISDIGYPPFVAPSASYDGNRGGWLGPYDPSFMIQRYAGGTSYVSPFR